MTSHMQDILKAVLWASLFAAIALGTGFITRALADHRDTAAWHADAVKAGKAEYYLDANHERQWRWLP